MSDMHNVYEKISNLEKVNEALLKSIQLLEDKIIRDSKTGLFNEEFFENYIKDILNASLPTHSPGAVLLISIDNFGDINLHYGSDRADEILKKYAAYLSNIIQKDAMLFRLSGALFACYLPHCEKQKAIEIAESIRVATAQADIFICFITVSIGLISFDELFERNDYTDSRIVDFIIDAGKQRLNIARKRGSNQVCAESNLEHMVQNKPVLLLADNNTFRLTMFAEFFSTEKFDVITTRTGPETLEVIKNNDINLILADDSLPGINAVEIKKLLTNTHD